MPSPVNVTEDRLAVAEQELNKLKLRIMAVKQYLRRTQEEGTAPTAVAVRALLDGEDDAR